MQARRNSASTSSSGHSSVASTGGLTRFPPTTQPAISPTTTTVKTPFLVTDNGSSFIARRFVRHIAGSYSHVRIQYRTPTQLGLLERFHKTLKVEEVYWRLYDSPAHCRECLEEFRQRYNGRRPHWALVPEEGGDPLVPAEVYRGDRAVRIPRWQGWAQGAKEKLDRMLAEAA